MTSLKTQDRKTYLTSKLYQKGFSITNVQPLKLQEFEQNMSEIQEINSNKKYLTNSPLKNQPSSSAIKQNNVNDSMQNSQILSQQQNQNDSDNNSKQILSQLQQPVKQSSNVRTFIRVRPLNKMEIEFNQNGCGNENLRFPDLKSVQVMPEKTIFTLDKVYPPASQQSEIYEDVGREMVNDVLLGYNGTIFAYGATGSGKTHTMFGNVNDQQQKGIIPRVSNQIFQYVNQSTDIEFSITCSMLEIYKEQLFDLLNTNKQNLKIKENAKEGGLYVQGLTNITVESEQDILDAINLGYSSKQTRETRMNEYSSRSHTIFTINVNQKCPNGQLKTGKMNLVDLAGCEKIAKTQAWGEMLEEAKKINLSLSCLGNVIHALTSGADHIPYRDSKLTRILQESLGGNFKTSLIAAISPHSSQHEEQISTLKFATRAKTIKNNVKINIILSNEQMKVLIEQLKGELAKSKEQNDKWKKMVQKLKEEIKNNNNGGSFIKNLEDIINNNDSEGSNTEQNNSINNDNGDESDLDESFVDQQGGNNQPSIFSGKRQQDNGGNQQNAFLNSSQKDNNNTGQYRGTSSDFRKRYQEKNKLCRNLQKEIIILKKELNEQEKKMMDIRYQKQQIEQSYTEQKSKNEYNLFQTEVLQKQVTSLIETLCKYEKQISKMIQEKTTNSKLNIEDYLKKKFNFQEISYSEYFKNSTSLTLDNYVLQWSDQQKKIQQLGVDFNNLFDENQEQEGNQNQGKKHTFTKMETLLKQTKGNINNSLNQKQMLEKITLFPSKLDKFHQKHHISRDLMIILLKKELFNSHIINQTLSRTISTLEWKQIIEYGKETLLIELNKVQKTHIDNLEIVINEASANYKLLRRKIEQIELEQHIQNDQKSQEVQDKKGNIGKDNQTLQQLIKKKVQKDKVLKVVFQAFNIWTQIKQIIIVKKLFKNLFYHKHMINQQKNQKKEIYYQKGYLKKQKRTFIVEQTNNQLNKFQKKRKDQKVKLIVYKMNLKWKLKNQNIIR
ncbi:kinesin motor domain protein, partial [Ichthyophthirius multifiliis]